MRPDLSRRQFLVQSAGVAGASLGLSARGAESEGGGGLLRLGFVGLGDRGRRLLGASLDLAGAEGDSRRVEIAALCDVDSRRLRSALEMVRRSAVVGATPPVPTASWRELLARPDVDAVVVATPVCEHAEQAVGALGVGKHVYLEKPLAATVEECRRIRDAARVAAEAEIVLQVGLQRRFSPRYRRGIELLGAELGVPLFVRAQWHSAGGRPRGKRWLHRRDTSGDAVVEQACHQFDVFNWVFGSVPERACGMGGVHRPSRLAAGADAMDHFAVVLEYPGGGKVSLSHVGHAPPDRRFAGVYELVFAERGGVDLGAGRWWRDDGESIGLDGPAGGDTARAVSGFVEAALGGEPSRAGIDVAYAATAAAILARRALETGKPVEWSEIDSV